MKSAFSLLPGILLSIIIPLHLFSQCGAGKNAHTITYDTTIYGTGSASYTLTVPKFNIPLGDLLSATIKSAINIRYSYTVDNTLGSTQIYKAQILRSDDISSAAIDPTIISATNQMSNVTHILPGGGHASYGPAYRQYGLKDSITTADGSLINFMGAGTVDFDYETGSTTRFQNGITVNPIVVDTVHFSVTYLYCLASLLSTDMLFFTAMPQAKNNVLLNWRQEQVEAGRMYGLQISTDGHSFATIYTTAENTTGSYAYTYLNNNQAKKLFFRIQERDVSGEIKYSEIRTVSFDGDTKDGINISPTLYTGGDMKVNFPEKSDWQIIMYAIDGRKISENTYSNAPNASIRVPGILGNGVYVVETLNIHSRQRQTTRIIIQR